MSTETKWDQMQELITPGDPTGRVHHLIDLAFHHKKGGRLLNIGAGYEFESSLFDIVNLDKYSDLNITGDATNLPLGNESFDAVMASELIEHFELKDGIRIVNEVRRVLKPGGVFVGSVPNTEDRERNMWLCPNCSFKFHRMGHRVTFDAEAIRELLKRSFPDTLVYTRIFCEKGLVEKAKKMVKYIVQPFGHYSNDHVIFAAIKR